MATIYADNAATTQMIRAAIDAMLPYLETIYGNPSSLHSVGQQAAGALLSARDRIAKCLNASPREIYFTSGGSEADNQAILSAARLGERKGKKYIISTAFEHHAVLHTLQKLEKEGFTVELLPVGPIGTVTAQQVKDAIREDTCLVSVMYANNEIGSILPISAIGAVCRAAGVLFHTDAVQAAGHLPIDVKAQNIDLLSLSAHKFHGPKGTGVLYARQGVFLTNLIEGGEGESLLLLLDAKGICASSGSACTSGSLDPSHVLLAIGRPHDVAHSSLRLSLCEWNTDEEIDRILDAVPEVVEYLRGMSPLWKDLVSGKKPFTL